MSSWVDRMPKQITTINYNNMEGVCADGIHSLVDLINKQVEVSWQVSMMGKEGCIIDLSLKSCKLGSVPFMEALVNYCVNTN